MKLVHIPFDELILGERQRKVYLEIEELAQSILQDGLIQPLIINNAKHILAGGRRYHAFKYLSEQGNHLEDIPCVMYENNRKTDQLCIELLENIQRQDFTWPEQVALVERVHLALLEENGATWTIEQTASRLSMSKGAVSKDLKLARSIQINPTITTAETKAKANFMIQNTMRRLESVSNVASLSDSDMEKLKAIVNCQSAKCDCAPDLSELQLDDMCHMGMENNRLVGKAGSGLINPVLAPESAPTGTQKDAAGQTPPQNTMPLEPPYRTVGGGQVATAPTVEPPQQKKIPTMAYHIKDYREILSELPDNSVGLIEVDPPYAIEFDKTYGKSQGLSSTFTDWDIPTFKDRMSEILAEAQRVLIPNSWCIVWSAYEHLPWLEKTAKKNSLLVQRPGVWMKPGGTSNHPKKRLTSNIEFFLLLGKGDPCFMTSMMLQGIYSKTSSAVDKIHTTEKPLALYEEIFKAIQRPASLFLTTMAGSGNSMIAAAKCGMHAIGCDIDPQYKTFFEGKIVKEFFNGQE